MSEEATTTETEETDDGITVLEERVSHMTEVKLSAEESLEALLDKLEEQDDAKEAARASASRFRDRLKTIEGELTKLRENGTTMRAFECRRIRDDRRGVVYFERLDTGDKLDERPLSAAERQAELPLDEPERGKVGPCCGTCEHWEPDDDESNEGECYQGDEEPEEGWARTHYADHCEEWEAPAQPDEPSVTGETEPAPESEAQEEAAAQ